MPVVALREAVDVLERELGRKLAALNVELWEDDPDIQDKVTAACRAGLITNEIASAWRDLAEQRDRTQGDLSGTHTTADQAQAAVVRARSLLAGLDAAEPASK